MTGAQLAAVELTGPAEPWVAMGFVVDEQGRVPLANGALVFGADAMGFVVDAGRQSPAGEIEGVSIRSGSVVDGVDHPNGAFELDHVVVMTDSLERTSAAIGRTLGLEQRRVRETPTVRQAFHRFADRGDARGCIVEVVENARVERTALWGVVVNVLDLDALCASAGDLVGAPKPAVQPERRIATVRSSAGLGTAAAFMSALSTAGAAGGRRVRSQRQPWSSGPASR